MADLKKFVRQQNKESQREEIARLEKIKQLRKEIGDNDREPKSQSSYSSGKGKILSPLQLYRQRQKDRQEVSKFRGIKRQQRFNKSFAGKFTRGFKKVQGVLRSPAQSLYSRGMSLQERTAMAKRIQAQKQFNKIQQQRAIQPPNFEQWVFSSWGSGSANNPCLQLEMELTNVGGHTTAGDTQAFLLDSTAFGFNPFADIEREVSLNANFGHRKGIKGVSQEADFFSNLIA